MSVHKHHRKLRAQGGDDSWGNLIKLPREYHDLIHLNPEVAYEHGLLVREHDDPAAIEPDLVGFLQAVGVESEPEQKPAKKRLQGTERRKRRTISIKVAADEEDGAGIYDDTLTEVKERLNDMGLIDPEKYPDPNKYPAYEATIAAWRDWLNS